MSPPKLTPGDFAFIAIAGCLAATASLAVGARRALYADGAYLFYHILGARGLFYSIPSRVLMYWAVEAPVAAALKLGVSDIRLLNALFNLGLVAVPVIILVAAALVARRSMVLLGATVVFIVAVYYPPAMFHVGEFVYPYALSWLAFVLMTVGTRRAAVLACLGSVLLLACYETALALGPLLAAIALYHAYRNQDRLAKALLIAAALFFLSSGAVSLLTLFHPVTPLASGSRQFRQTLFRPGGTVATWAAFGFAVVAAAVGLTMRDSRRLPIAAALLVAGLALLIAGAHYRPDVPVFGIPYDQRSTAFVILFASICGTFILHRVVVDFRPDAAGAAIILVPVLLAAGADIYSTQGWTGYLGDFCTELGSVQGKTDATAFHARHRRYGWNWTNPFLSVLMRPAGSQAVILNPTDWQIEVPDLDPQYKAAGSLCIPAATGAL